MPRIADGRTAAEPSSQLQKERYQRILRAAARLGAANGYDHVQMHDVAKDAGVAIATLYRYFPSKVELFASVMRWRVSRYDGPATVSHHPDPATAVGDLLVAMSREMVRVPKLSLAMMHANNQAQAAGIADAGINDSNFRRILLTTLGVQQPTEEDERLVRLIVHCWYGVLVSTLNGRLDMEQCEGDIRAACRMLTAATSH